MNPKAITQVPSDLIQQILNTSIRIQNTHDLYFV